MAVRVRTRKRRERHTLTQTAEARLRVNATDAGTLSLLGPMRFPLASLRFWSLWALIRRKTERCITTRVLLPAVTITEAGFTSSESCMKTGTFPLWIMVVALRQACVAPLLLLWRRFRIFRLSRSSFTRKQFPGCWMRPKPNKRKSRFSRTIGLPSAGSSLA